MIGLMANRSNSERLRGFCDRQTDRRTDGQTDGQADRLTDGWTYRQSDEGDKFH